jgi:1-acyl-sn-glycerol-3-phosphate acyltransferase
MDITSPKVTRHSVNNIRPHAWIVRFVLRWISRFFTTFLTRTRVIGKENIPATGPAIFAANHSSIYDAILYFAYLPARTQYVGPGDFRLRYPNRMAAEWTDVILVKRGSSDTTSLRAMLDTLKSGGFIGLFPEGGTWEKRLYDVKDGAAYLSMVAQAPIVPIALSGTYDLWKDIFSFKRPEIVMQILPPMSAVPKATRNNRKEILTQGTYDLMHRIYEVLTDAELERYKVYMRQRFTGRFEVKGGTGDWFADAHNYGVLAELVTKKNLFSTFHEHLRLPLYPLMNLRRFHRLRGMRAAINSLHHALLHDVPGYIEYRLGDEAAQKILVELEEIKNTLNLIDDRTVRLRFVVEIEEDKDMPISLDPPPIEEAQVGAM